MTLNVRSSEILDEVIIGRVSPHIYAFITHTIPNYLKVGDTYRPVSTRLREWARVFPRLEQKYEREAAITEDVYFRDHAVHSYLERELGRSRLSPEDFGRLAAGIPYSNEFFYRATSEDVDEAIEDITEAFENQQNRYSFYDAHSRLPESLVYKRGSNWELRPNQAQAVANFVTAVENNRDNLLMYAVMRFGKSFTALSCAKAINARLVVVVSAKADVKNEWKKTVEQPGNFENFTFLDATALELNKKAIDSALKDRGTAVLFLTLQDLQGAAIKAKHKSLYESSVDLLIIDETHFGARGEEYGKVLRQATSEFSRATQNREVKAQLVEDDDAVNLEAGETNVKAIDAKVRLHLSGTPYRILMGSEFEKEDIISFVQFSDIVAEQEKWDAENLLHDNYEEWDNPYFGFPQMVRFAFNPNASSRRKLEELRESGVSYALSALLEPQAIELDKKHTLHRKFKYPSEILELLKVIDGSETDDALLSFLDYDKIKDGDMCRHMVMVLPFRASCDAMEQLIIDYRDQFKNLANYRLINISGLEAKKRYPTPEHVKNTIRAAENTNQMTLTLTVNRMLTGSTVEQWDTMLYLKDTASPQEYDQAIFRLQNQYIRTLKSGNRIVRENLKPQTLLVDFDPARLFRMQEQKSLIYNANVDSSGNSELQERIEEELRISPVITMNHNRIRQVEATNILEAVADYNRTRSLSDEVRDIPVDLRMLETDESLMQTILSQAELGSKKGLALQPNKGEGDDIDVDPIDDTDERGRGGNERPQKKRSESEDSDETKSLERKLQTYYQRLLFYALLTPQEVRSLSDIVSTITEGSNPRIARNLGIEPGILRSMLNAIDPFKLNTLDYKIQNASYLSRDEKLEPLERATRALEKFSRISLSEVRTPSDICEQMVAQIPAEVLVSAIKQKSSLLDIASKFGEFTVALYKRLIRELGLSHEEVRSELYAIPTSSVAYEFTRKFYEILNLDISRIAQSVNTYDLLGEIRTDAVSYFESTANLRSIFRKEQQAESAIDSSKEAVMKFGAVVGNPPYQMMDKGEGSGASPVYHEFLDLAHTVSDIAILIHPSRFLFNNGKTPKRWNKKMLSSPYFSVAKYWSDATEVFDTVEIKGGVVISIWDATQVGEPIGTFVPSPKMRRILDKVTSRSTESFADLVYPRDLYRLSDVLYEDFPGLEGRQSRGHKFDLGSNIFEKMPEIFVDRPPQAPGYVRVFGRNRSGRQVLWTKKKYLTLPDNFNSYKVVLPKTNGSGYFGERLSDPFVADPGDAHTLTFLSIGSFATRGEAEGALKYVKTRFARALLGTLKSTQDNSRGTWLHVPNQDFSSDGDIDWSMPVDGIDAQLFAKYSLSSSEITFLQDNVLPM